MALRQRGGNKKGTKEEEALLLLPIVSVDTKHYRRRRRRRRSTRHKCQLSNINNILILVLSSIIVFTITFIYSFQRAEKNEIIIASHYFQCLQYPHIKGYFLNDDYCDCPDGSDEPLTSACSHLLVGQKTFLCTAPSTTATATGEAIIQLSPSRIHDGVVDCHDGLDEK